MPAHAFLEALTIVVATAAVTTVVFQWLKQPVVLGYIVAGVLVGPYVPVPLTADQHVVESVSELGIVFLMFALGLELSIRKLVELAPTASLAAIIETSAMAWLGYLAGRAFGWTSIESIFTGAIVALSSTSIVAKAFQEQKIEGPVRTLVYGILVIEDLIAILWMAALTAIASGTGANAGALLQSGGRLAGFLAALVIVGLLVVPRFVRFVQKLGRPETTLVASVGLAFGCALLCTAFGYSVALGAFVAGSLIAESGEGKTIAHLLEPLRDLFGAIFFVSVGMLINPQLIWAHAGAAIALTVLVIVGKAIGVTTGAFLVGSSVRNSVRAGLSLGQIGELSFIVAGLGISLGATRPFLYPVTLAVAALTTWATPWAIRGAEPISRAVDRRLPPALQTFASLYGGWLERARARRRETRPARRAIFWLLADAGLLVALLIGSATLFPRFATRIEALGLPHRTAPIILVLAAFLASAPLLVGIVRSARTLGLSLAHAAFPDTADSDTDLGAPRRAITITIEALAILIVALPVLLVAQPFLPRFATIPLFLFALVVLVVAIIRRAGELESPMRRFATQLADAIRAHPEPSDDRPSVVAMSRVLEALGRPVAVRIDHGNPVVGQTLGSLNLRGATGATVVAIVRSGRTVLLPAADEVLLDGDLLALAGAEEHVTAAVAVLAPNGDSISRVIS